MAGRGRNVKPQLPDPKKVPDFSQEDLDEIKEAFDIFDKEGGGMIDLGQMLDFLESIKSNEKNPTVFHWIEMLYNDFQEGISFKDFMEGLQSLIGDTSSEDGLLRLFEVIDVEAKEFIDKDRLKGLAREIGENPPDEELDELIENYYECPTGKVDSESFVKMMLKSAL